MELERLREAVMALKRVLIGMLSERARRDGGLSFGSILPHLLPREIKEVCDAAKEPRTDLYLGALERNTGGGIFTLTPEELAGLHPDEVCTLVRKCRWGTK